MMFKVTWSSTNNRSGSAQWETNEEATNWINSCISLNAWGRPRRWVAEFDLSAEEISFAVTSREVVDQHGEKYYEYFLNADYEYETIDITEEHDVEQARERRLTSGRLVHNVCSDILALILGFNLERNLTAAQITEMEETFSTINALLQSDRPFSARPLIEAITPDSVLITEEMKSVILNEYERL